MIWPNKRLAAPGGCGRSPVSGARLTTGAAWVAITVVMGCGCAREVLVHPLDPAWLALPTCTPVSAASARSAARELEPARFVNRGDVVLDTDTHLMWAARDNRESTRWDAAAAYVRTLSLGGFNDWRLPTVDEVQTLAEASIIRHDCRGPLEVSSWFWSMDDCEGGKSLVNPGGGDVNCFGQGFGYGVAFPVRSMRAGE